jgi:hypothetical protein
LDGFLELALLEDPSLREMHSCPSSAQEFSGDFFPDKCECGALRAVSPWFDDDAGCMFSMISTSSSSMISTDEES